MAMTRKFLWAGMNSFPWSEVTVPAASSCWYRIGWIMWVPSSRFLEGVERLDDDEDGLGRTFRDSPRDYSIRA